MKAPPHLEHGARYRAKITFGTFNPKRFASNDQIAAKFLAAGFTNVSVAGSGGLRWAFGEWPNATIPFPGDLPGEIDEVEKL